MLTVRPSAYYAAADDMAALRRIATRLHDDQPLLRGPRRDLANIMQAAIYRIEQHPVPDDEV